MSSPLSNYPEGVTDKTINEAIGEELKPYPIGCDTKEEAEE